VQLPGGRGFGLAFAWLSPDAEIAQRASIHQRHSPGRPTSTDLFPRTVGATWSLLRRGLDVLSSGRRRVLKTAFVLIRLIPLLLIFTHERLLESNPS
jgi:hypothetical protein